MFFESTSHGVRLKEYYRDRILFPLVIVVILSGVLCLVMQPAKQITHSNFDKPLLGTVSHTSLPTKFVPMTLDANSRQMITANATTTGRQAILRVAEIEIAKRPRAFDSNVLKYTQGTREAWCADFVSYVYKESNQTFTNYTNGSWRISGVRGMRDHFESKGQYRRAGSYVPRSGDVAFYMIGGWNHVNIVMATNGNEMITIGGNENRTVMRTSHPFTYGRGGLVGFGVPD